MTRPAGSGNVRRAVVPVLLTVAAALALLVAAGGIWLYTVLRGSLPQLDGEAALPGLAAPVSVTRDAFGVPTIRGANRGDVAHATGFLHAQERYFQMDLLRRSAAGELAELVGEGALEVDRTNRVHRFRARARAALEGLPPQERALVEAYAGGVNAGLAALAWPPFEYLLLRATPAPWSPDDTLLAIYAMYLDLQGMQWARESTLGLMHDVLPEPLYAFLAPRGTEWETPLEGGPLPLPPLPGPQVVDLRGRPQVPGGGELSPAPGRGTDPDFARGSNSWAVAGGHTRHGGALLANDMHLRIGVPNIWYRASLVYPDPAGGGERRITGVTLPGVPAMVVGSNGRVAWGFTNSEGDWSDLVILDPAPGESDAYLTPDGPRRFERERETIRVKGGGDQAIEVVWTLWGPVIDTDHRGRQRALRWVAHDREAANLGALRLEAAGTVEEALDVASRVGAPAQNFVAADSEGHIGWTLFGPIPRRFGHDGRLPASWADGSRGWDGWLAPEAYPRIVDPSLGRIWTANARVVEGDRLAVLGDGGYALGVRARRIRDTLLAIDRADEAAMLALQLDDRARFLERWRDLLLRVLTPEALAADPRRRELREYVEHWGDRAAVDSVGYRLVRAFRTTLAEQALAPLLAPCRRADPRFDYGWVRQHEGPLWRLVSEQPEHLLDPRYRAWQEQFLAAVDAMLGRFLSDGSSLGERTWGEYNTSEFRHPLSRFIPGAGRWLDMPPTPLPGDIFTPRAQTSTEGASERMVVAPGREAEGIFEMPGGQSGHPLSPHYRDSHDAWVRGDPTPFLAGPPRHTLRLVP